MHKAVPPSTFGSRVSVAQHKEVVPIRTRLILNVRKAFQEMPPSRRIPWFGHMLEMLSL